MGKITVLGDFEKVFPSSPKVRELEQKGYTFDYAEPRSDSDTVEALKNADIAILVRERAKMPRHVIEQLPNLQMISQTGSGTAHLDKGALEENNIKLTLTGGTSAPSVVELTFGMIIGCMRQFTVHRNHLMQEQWKQIPGFELQHKRIGLIGYGEISREIAKVAQAFQMEPVTWRPTGEKGDEEIPVLELDELLATSDIVSIHVRLVPELKNVLNREKLFKMKKGSVLINTARGALIDNQALIELLESGHLLGAGIDTYPEEPLTENPFKNCPNVILTPHIGYITWEVLQRFADISLENIIGNLPTLSKQ
ncbi:NAD(P)-dependent oxidoreductase [Bacillus daqingensis]|uniref:NAD(P)-dependent oxidoreductase n=1 Tax=Bacillus daqingensis TaxID=872396 RepID=A0ABV9NY86_9BACI